MNDKPTAPGSHRWRFEPVFNLGHIIMLIGLLGGGLSVYVGVFQTLTSLVVRVQGLEAGSAKVSETHDLTITNSTNIEELRALTTSIRDSNTKMLEQLTNIRIDLGILKREQSLPADVSP